MKIFKRIIFVLCMIVLFVPTLMMTVVLSIPVWLFTGKDILNPIGDFLLTELLKITE